MSSSFLKRLEALERSISFRRPRCIVVTVPTSKDGSTTAETKAGIAELKRDALRLGFGRPFSYSTPVVHSS
jgi:hypothetical protein